MLLAVPVLLAGCGGGSGPSGDVRDEASPTSSAARSPVATASTSSSSAEPSDLLKRYLEVFATADADQLRSDWVPMTAPGSLARLYSEHHTTFRQALEESGAAPLREDTVETTDVGVQICTGEAFCRTYTDAAAQDGLLTNFTVNDEALEGHVVQPGARGSVNGLTVELVSGYETSRRALFLCARATNGGEAPVSINAVTATYPGPDGQPSMAAEAPGTLDPISPGGNALVCPVFQVGQPGGRLRLEITSGTAATPTPLELPVVAASG